MATPSRVELRLEHTGGVGSTEISVDIFTGGRTAPLVTLADNNGFPEVAALYARSREVEGGIGRFWCISLTIRFVSPIGTSASALAINCYQEDAAEYRHPWFS